VHVSTCRKAYGRMARSREVHCFVQIFVADRKSKMTVDFLVWERDQLIVFLG
jgi:hypothetical protein